MLILLALERNVVVGYIINEGNLKRYTNKLAKYRITPVFRVLVPERSVCLERDIVRDCLTAGKEWVDKWYDEQRSFLTSNNSVCIDSSHEFPK